MGMDNRELSAILQFATVDTIANAQVGGPIPLGYKRKITRIHIPANGAGGDDRFVLLFLGDSVNPIRVPLDSIAVAAGNPDYNENVVRLDSPLFTLRPDETPLNATPVGAVQNNLLTVESAFAGNIVLSVTYYDERQ